MANVEFGRLGRPRICECRSEGFRYAARRHAKRARSFIKGTARLILLDETAYPADLEGIGCVSDPAGPKGQFSALGLLRRIACKTL